MADCGQDLAAAAGCYTPETHDAIVAYFERFVGDVACVFMPGPFLHGERATVTHTRSRVCVLYLLCSRARRGVQTMQMGRGPVCIQPGCGGYSCYGSTHRRRAFAHVMSELAREARSRKARRAKRAAQP